MWKILVHYFVQVSKSVLLIKLHHIACKKERITEYYVLLFVTNFVCGSHTTHVSCRWELWPPQSTSLEMTIVRFVWPHCLMSLVQVFGDDPTPMDNVCFLDILSDPIPCEWWCPNIFPNPSTQSAGCLWVICRKPWQVWSHFCWQRSKLLLPCWLSPIAPKLTSKKYNSMFLSPQTAHHKPAMWAWTRIMIDRLHGHCYHAN